MINNLLLEECLIVSEEQEGKRIDQVLAYLYPSFSRAQWIKWLKSGLITLNKKSCKPKEKVVTGDAINLQINLEEISRPHSALPESIPLSVAYEDEWLMIIDKPAGLVVHPGAGNPQSTLMNALLHYDETLNRLPRAGIIHRLDKDTTGLLIIAKTIETHTALIRQMQAREIERRYLALVHGHLIAGGEVDAPIGRHPTNRLKMAVKRDGREAMTCYRIKERFEELTLLEINLLTGRTHQIRVHMTHINHPIIGDSLYGGRARIPANLSETVRNHLSQFKRQALHAFELKFEHPITGDQLHIKSELPEDFKELLDVIR